MTPQSIPVSETYEALVAGVRFKTAVMRACMVLKTSSTFEEEAPGEKPSSTARRAEDRTQSTVRNAQRRATATAGIRESQSLDVFLCKLMLSLLQTMLTGDCAPLLDDDDVGLNVLGYRLSRRT